MTTGADIEERWILLWSELYEARERDPQLRIVDENWQPIPFEDCKGLVQVAVYAGRQPRFESTWRSGTQVLQVLETGPMRGSS